MINPYIGALSDECMQLIGLGDHKNMNQKELAQYLSGNKLFQGS